jgi:uncharacterized membrane protein YoaK (UPF0700 family)
MHTFNKGALALAVCLSSLAGCVDAIGFLQLRGYFVSFMSGNSTLLAVGLAHGERGAALLLGTIIGLFITGAIVGTLIGHRVKASHHAVAVLALVTTLLTLGALCHMSGRVYPAVAFITLAMGAENAVAQRAGDVVVGLTYMTGTLFKIGQRIAQAFLGGPAFAWLPYFLLWSGLLCGGICGAWLYGAIGLKSLWVAALWAAALTILAQLTKAFVPFHDRRGRHPAE